MEDSFNEREVSAESNRCKNCGGEMKYDIASTDLKCERCGSTYDFDESGAVQRRAMTQDIMQNREQWQSGAVFRCDGCGAKEILDKKEMAKCCAFCGSAHIVSTQELPGIKPDSLIPFQITKDTARTKFINWLKAKWFAPKKVKKMERNEQFNALYSSSWSFSANTHTRYQGILGRTETRTRTVNGRTQTYSTVRYFRVQGDIGQNYRDFFVQSGDKIQSATFNKLKPFNMSYLKVYRQEYLAGIVAEHYSRNIETCFDDFTTFVKRDLRNKIIRRHNADTVQSLTLNTAYTDKAYNYVLLPIYIANYIFKKKLYNFFVNGVTGKVIGKYPISGWKIFFTVLTIGVLSAAAGYLGYFFFG